SGSGIVELSAVHQFLFFVKHIKIRCAGSIISLGDFLGFIIQIGERVMVFFSKYSHFFRAVLWVFFHIVAAYGYKTKALHPIVICRAYDLIHHMFYKWAMVAYKHHYQAVFAIYILQ